MKQHIEDKMNNIFSMSIEDYYKLENHVMLDQIMYWMFPDIEFYHKKNQNGYVFKFHKNYKIGTCLEAFQDYNDFIYHMALEEFYEATEDHYTFNGQFIQCEANDNAISEMERLIKDRYWCSDFNLRGCDLIFKEA